MFGISKPDFLGHIIGILGGLTCAILWHTIRAEQMAVHLETCNLQPEALGGQPDPEPRVLTLLLR